MKCKFAELLLADGPGKGTGDETLFGQFIGSWEIDITWYERGKQASRARGEWHFAWVLDGRAIQDIWIVPTLAEQRNGAPPYEYGTSLRIPDPSGDFWHSTWHGPVRGMIATFTARRRGEEIVLDGQAASGMRWIFSDITTDRFRWRNEKFISEGAPWVLVQDFVAVRLARHWVHSAKRQQLRISR